MPDDRMPVETLTRRELQVFDRVLAGSTTRQIAEEFGLSIKTVETHRFHINTKLGVHSPADMIRRAAAEGRIPRMGEPPTAAPAAGDRRPRAVLVVAESTVRARMLTLRALRPDGQPEQLHGGDSLREALASAGFRPGDVVEVQLAPGGNA
jgi:DNA-binding CsgD family transcriptional regulator